DYFCAAWDDSLSGILF
nr:immunoglobulin light chain junction region [Macaca mulatta]